MITIKIDSSQIKKLGNVSRKLDTATKDTGFLKSTGQLLVSRGKQNLEDGGSPTVSWPLLAESTRKQKLNHPEGPFSLKPLQRTNELRKSLNFEVTGGLYVSGLDYLKYHQSDEPRTIIPERKVYTVEPDDLLDIRDFLIRGFNSKS
jgi:hypothetical protein